MDDTRADLDLAEPRVSEEHAPDTEQQKSNAIAPAQARFEAAISQSNSTGDSTDNRHHTQPSEHTEPNPSQLTEQRPQHKSPDQVNFEQSTTASGTVNSVTAKGSHHVTAEPTQADRSLNSVTYIPPQNNKAYNPVSTSRDGQPIDSASTPEIDNANQPGNKTATTISAAAAGTADSSHQPIPPRYFQSALSSSAKIANTTNTAAQDTAPKFNFKNSTPEIVRATVTASPTDTPNQLQTIPMPEPRGVEQTKAAINVKSTRVASASQPENTTPSIPVEPRPTTALTGSPQHDRKFIDSPDPSTPQSPAKDMTATTSTVDHEPTFSALNTNSVASPTSPSQNGQMPHEQQSVSKTPGLLSVGDIEKSDSHYVERSEGLLSSDPGNVSQARSATSNAFTAPETPKHIAQQLSGLAPLVQGRPVELALSPDELGKVQLTLNIHEGNVSVSIVAERTETIDLMRRHADLLEKEFRELGYDNIDFHFGQQTDQNEGSDKHSTNDGSAQDIESTNNQDNEPTRILLDAQGGVDLRF
ncbi:flagellar hook-length control protein FliK [Cochlodiniinecator piscidefendens]|uniref:flagellar hook-length control protein FliK n=1 Tax=Cochlodiniinecator piscidefendens TaxID=2715756 RepID=UPI00140E8597|nr:flagellar hook-length control protein FliK [Cochlodiniinecator piscidefendens]